MSLRKRPIRWLIQWQREPMGEHLAKHGFDPRLKEALRRRRIACRIVYRRMVANGAPLSRQGPGWWERGRTTGLCVRIQGVFTRWMPTAEEWRRMKATQPVHRNCQIEQLSLCL